MKGSARVYDQRRDSRKVPREITFRALKNHKKMNSSEKPHEEIQFSLVPQLFIPLLKDYAPNLFEKSLPLLFFFFLILLLTKVLNAAPKHPVRDMLYHTSQELVWFSHEKQSGIPDCLKNPILDRYGTVLYWYILSGSVRFGFGSSPV